MIRSYVDIDQKYLPILGCWIIGTHFHNIFQTYPYLFINATKGGGKTRTLRLISFLARNGSMDVNLTEAVLFRKASAKVSFCIDELEHVSSKEKANLRLLLNAAYKKGIGVERARKNPNTERYEIDRFEVFAPIAMANIWGLDDVLQDRCIVVVLEKSVKMGITRKVELWPYDKGIKLFNNFMDNYWKTLFLSIKDIESEVCEVTMFPGILYNIFPVFWNMLMETVSLLENNTNNFTTSSSSTTSPNFTYNDIIESVDWSDANITTAELTNELCNLGRKIWESGIFGRDLELFLPLIMIAHEIDKDVLEDVIKSAKLLCEDKKVEDVADNRDTLFISFLMGAERTEDWILVREMAKDFKNLEEYKWINSRWVGHALRRLQLYKIKKHTNKGRVVQMNWDKLDAKARQLGIDVEDIKTVQKPDQKTIDEAVDELSSDLGVPEIIKAGGLREEVD